MGMSKHNPNQDFYKIGGRSQSEGPDRAAAPQKSPPRPGSRDGMRGKQGDPNFIPGEAPVGESKDE